MSDKKASTNSNKANATQHCPHCNTELPLQARFCRSCGEKIPPVESTRPAEQEKVKPNTDARVRALLESMVGDKDEPPGEKVVAKEEPRGEKAPTNPHPDKVAPAETGGPGEKKKVDPDRAAPAIVSGPQRPPAQSPSDADKRRAAMVAGDATILLNPDKKGAATGRQKDAGRRDKDSDGNQDQTIRIQPNTKDDTPSQRSSRVPARPKGGSNTVNTSSSRAFFAELGTIPMPAAPLNPSSPAPSTKAAPLPHSPRVPGRPKSISNTPKPDASKGSLAEQGTVPLPSSSTKAAPLPRTPRAPVRPQGINNTIKSDAGKGSLTELRTVPVPATPSNAVAAPARVQQKRPFSSADIGTVPMSAPIPKTPDRPFSYAGLGAVPQSAQVATTRARETGEHVSFADLGTVPMSAVARSVQHMPAIKIREKTMAPWVWPAALLLSVVVTALVTFIYPDAPVRPFVVMAFVLFSPGWMLVRFMKLHDFAAQISLTIALSISVVSLIATIQLYAHRWSPDITFAILLGFTFVGALVQLIASRFKRGVLAVV